MKHYLNPDQRRKSIKVWVSDEERALVEAKAYNYGYRRIAPYIRDAAIYERVTNYKIKGEDEIINAYCESNKEIQSMLKDVKHICKFATQISESKRQELLDLTKAIYKMQIKIRDLITKKLDLEMWQKINRNKSK
ncbi:MAG: hypothetical protein HFJ53_04940 [Clostridia bacterium]|jgi:hypothetical protein|nr:hypothetical protein [Clostridia bacterium]